MRQGVHPFEDEEDDSCDGMTGSEGFAYLFGLEGGLWRYFRDEFEAFIPKPSERMKDHAFHRNKHTRAYQPLNVWWAEHGVIL